MPGIPPTIPTMVYMSVPYIPTGVQPAWLSYPRVYSLHGSHTHGCIPGCTLLTHGCIPGCTLLTHGITVVYTSPTHGITVVYTSPTHGCIPGCTSYQRCIPGCVPPTNGVIRRYPTMRRIEASILWEREERMRRIEVSILWRGERGSCCEESFSASQDRENSVKRPAQDLRGG